MPTTLTKALSAWNRVIKSTILKVDPSSVVKGVTQIAQASLLSGWSRAAMAYVGSIGISPDEAADKATKARYEKLDDFRDIHNENHALAILHRLHMPLASLKKNLKARNGDPDWDILLGKTLDTGGDLTLSLEYMSKELAAVVAKYPPCPDDAAHANADRFLSSATKVSTSMNTLQASVVLSFLIPLTRLESAGGGCAGLRGRWTNQRTDHGEG